MTNQVALWQTKMSIWAGCRPVLIIGIDDILFLKQKSLPIISPQEIPGPLRVKSGVLVPIVQWYVPLTGVASNSKSDILGDILGASSEMDLQMNHEPRQELCSECPAPVESY